MLLREEEGCFRARNGRTERRDDGRMAFPTKTGLHAMQNYKACEQQPPASSCCERAQGACASCRLARLRAAKQAWRGQPAKGPQPGQQRLVHIVNHRRQAGSHTRRATTQ
jgi:hypothetical protein